MPEDRRLVAIMFTDIVGYTSLMSESEKKTLDILRINREIHISQIEKHGGKFIKELGDGILAIFENGTDAVSCAIDIQVLLKERDISLRIGIHEGEVLMENNDVFGEGVNIASRIQAEAAAGGVCISDTIYRIIRNKEAFKIGKIGKVSLKNVKDKILLYQLKSPGLASRSIYKSRNLNLLSVFIIALIALITGTYISYKYLHSKNKRLIKRTAINLPDSAPISGSVRNPIAISPDDKLIVYVGQIDGTTQLCKRYLNAYSVESIPGTEGADYPFFSTDGNWIGYYSNRRLFKVSIGSGKIHKICDISSIDGAVWIPNDSIIFGGVGGLKIVHSKGGIPKDLIKVDNSKGEVFHSNPTYINETNTILYTSYSGSYDAISINLLNYKTGKTKILIKNAHGPKYVKGGYILYEYDNSIFINSYNATEEILKDPSYTLFEVSESIARNVGFRYDVSGAGTLIYIENQNRSGMSELVEVDMNGRIESLSKTSDRYAGPKYSPDGNNLALWIGNDENAQVWIYNFERESLTRFTSEGQNFWPIWTKDGKFLYFPSLRQGSQNVNIFGKSFENPAPAKQLVKSQDIQQPKAITNDGKKLLFHNLSNKGFDINIYNFETNKIEPFLNNNYEERKPSLSPDNKWVVYETNETGNFEVYITKLSERSKKIKISADGGYEPLWSPKGNRIFYRNGNTFNVVNVSFNPKIYISKSKIIFKGDFPYSPRWGRNYDLSPDEKHFIMIKKIAEDSIYQSLNVITNFTEEFKQ